MNPELFRRACEVFEAARTAAPEDRERVVEEACAGDERLAAEVRDLLRHHDEGEADEPPDGPGPGDVLDGYTLQGRLGEGGMGLVFRATAASGEPVAVKVLHAHLGRAGRHRERFLREARIGVGVRHPAVVRVLDAGIGAHAGRDVPYLVMELVEGQSLRALQGELGRGSEDLCRHVARELADGLAAIHASGAVHRDVKPDNVLVTRDHVVKLTDLGVAQVADATQELSRSGAFVGSLGYASPEQFESGAERLDGRADLHALGIVLYELATGENPFAGDGLATIMRRVLEVRPARLGDLVPQVSAFFEEVVHTLLEKDPADRFASAAELRDVLDEGEDSAWWRERQAQLRARSSGRLRRIRVPRETALHGRGEQLEALEAAFARAAAGDGAVVLVDGEPGIGKTRLVDELVARLERVEDPPELLFGAYSHALASGAPGAVLAALREHFGSGDVGARVAELLPDAPALVAGLVSLVRGEPPADGAAQLTRDAQETAVVRLVHALARRRPVVLVVDDLQLAPVEGRALFQTLAQSAPGRRLLLVGTSRPGLPGRYVARLTGLAHVVRMTLPRLGARDLGALLADAFRSDRLADELGWELARKTDGNPFFVFEILRGLRDSGQLRRGPDGTWSTTGVIREFDVPSAVTDLIEARIAELSEEEQEILDVASCCGFEFEPALVAAALGSARIPVLRALGRVERRHGLVRASGPRFVFDHHQLHEAVYSRLSPALRAEYHAVLGGAQEQRLGERGVAPGDVRGSAAAQLAGHLLRGGEPERARPYVDAALDHVEARSKDEAAALCRLALQACGGDEDVLRLSILRRLVGCLEHLGLPDEHEAALDEAEQLARRLGDRLAALDLHGRRGWLYFSTGRAAEAEELLQEALAGAQEEGDARLVCTLLGHLGAAAASRARFDVARERFQSALERAEQLGDRQLQANALGGLGSAAWATGDFDTARRCDERALELAVALGDRRREAVAAGNLGSMFSSLGLYARSLELQRRRLRISREIGYRRGEAIATGNLGLAMSILGHVDESVALHERQVALCREVGHRRGEAAALLSLAAAHVAQGRHEEAASRARTVIGIAQEIGARDLRATAEQQLGDTLHALGRIDEARAHLATARELAVASGVAIESVISVLLGARLPGGDVDAACAVYEEQRDRLPLRVRMHAEHLMYRITGRREHCDAAWTRLAHLRDNAPPEYRDSLMRDQALHRAIAEDAAAAGGSGTEPPAV